jgi:regulator of protease activity HflC (stomatin/prohibitin superfamily)
MNRYTHSRSYKTPIIIASIAVLAIIFAAFVTTSVPAQNVGVVTAFGKPLNRNLEPGLHIKAPWHKVSDMDGTIQQWNNVGLHANNEDKTDWNRERGRIKVRLNDNSEMFVDNTLRWKIKTEAASTLYKDWSKGESKDVVEDKVATGLISTELNSAIQTAVASYDPLKSNTGDQSYDALAKKVVTDLVGADGKGGRVGNKIEVVSFNIVGINFDDKTQERIRQYNEEVQKTRIATQKASTNREEKLAVAALKGIYDNPNALRNKCLDIAKDNGANLPPSFTCYGEGATPVLPVK